MRQSHQHGEDKPPSILSTNILHPFDSNSFTRQPCDTRQDRLSTVNGDHTQLETVQVPDTIRTPPNDEKTSIQKQGHPDDIASTDTPPDVTADRCTTLDQIQLDLGKQDLPIVQASHNASVISENEASNGGHHSPTTYENPAGGDDHTFPEGGLAAWLVVFGSWSGMIASFGLLNSVGTLQAYLSEHQLSHHSATSIGLVFSIFAFLTFFCGVQIGPVFDAKGSKWLVAAGTICLVFGLLGTAQSTKLWHFILTFSIVSGVGSSLIFTPAVGACAHWFKRRRAVVTGLATTGGSIGGIVFPLMLQRLFPLVGFRWAIRILAFILLFLLSIANLLIRTRLTPKDRAKNGEKGVVPVNIKKDIWPDFRIFKHPVFALTTAGVFFIEWALFIPISYISSYALAHGVNSTFSYQVLAILNVGSFFGRWFPGYIADKFGRFNTMIGTVLLCLISVLCLWLTCSPESGAGGIAQLIIFALIFGFASGSNISLTPVCVGQLCDIQVFGRWYASLYSVVSFGVLTGIPIGGQLLASFDNQYTGLIIFTGVCYGLGLLCFVWARVLSVGWDVRKIY